MKPRCINQFFLYEIEYFSNMNLIQFFSFVVKWFEMSYYHQVLLLSRKPFIIFCVHQVKSLSCILNTIFQVLRLSCILSYAYTHASHPFIYILSYRLKLRVLLFFTAAVSQLVRVFASNAESFVFESQPRQT